MKTLFPNYENGLVNAMSSIQKHFGIKTNHSSLKILDERLSRNNYKNIVLILFDGLGYNILKRNKDYCPFLNKYLVSSLSSTFPSTTMAARTTIESGLNPIEHGWLGWDMYFKEFNNVITISRNYVKRTKEKLTDYHIARTLLKYESVVSKIDKLDGCHAKKISVYNNHKNESLKKARKQIKRITKNDEKNYIYFYVDDPDHTFHKYGCNSKQAIKKIKNIDKEFKNYVTL